jgi:hypothetical protein
MLLLFMAPSTEGTARALLPQKNMLVFPCLFLASYGLMVVPVCSYCVSVDASHVFCSRYVYTTLATISYGY